MPPIAAADASQADGTPPVADDAAGTVPARPLDAGRAANLKQTASVRGRVVWIGDALDRRFGIALDPQAKERMLALETDDGQLLPLVEDTRGRAFRRDPRLRDRDVELLVRQLPGTGLIQVIRVHFIKPDGKFVVDYWCDICAIAMYEDGPCQCCQQPNQLRERPVD